jgi:carbamoyltransferase
MPRYILGLSTCAHDTSAALLRDGAIVATSEEERFDRIKHSTAFPEAAIKFCLARAGIQLSDVHDIALFWRPGREVTGNLLHVIRYFPGSLHLLRSQSYREMGVLERLLAMWGTGRDLRRRFDLPRTPRVQFIEHHLSHAASAFYPSPFEESAILTLDGRGESTCTMLARARGGRIEKLREIPVPHSLGHFYGAITGHLGFKPFFDEWKVMGMSAYGRPTRVEEMRELIRLDSRDLFELDLSYFRFHTRGQSAWLSEKFYRQFGPPRRAGSEPTQEDYDLAYAAQKVVEEAGLHLARTLREWTGEKRLCVAGGVALNCLMNRRLVGESGFEEFFFQPIAGDGGASLGAALYTYHHVRGGQDRHRLRDVYFGPEFSGAELEAALKAKGVPYRRSENVVAETAAHLAAGKIVGWFQGRMEAGPRALGNRSILVDPTRPDMKDRLNARVKRREGFRPFAPAVPLEHCAEIFDLPRNVPSPHMMLIGDVRLPYQPRLPAITHADGTARVQSVAREDNPRFHALLTEFGRVKGVPVILNTSFNENEPIVCGPAEAIDCFLRTGLDILVLGDFIAER